MAAEFDASKLTAEQLPDTDAVAAFFAAGRARVTGRVGGRAPA